MLQRLPLWGALIVLAGAMAAGVYAFVRTQFLLWILLAIAGVAIFAAVYLYEYSQLPGPPGWFSPGPERPTATADGADGSPPAASAEPSREETPKDQLPIVADPEDLDPDFDPVAEADRLDSESPRPPPPET